MKKLRERTSRTALVRKLHEEGNHSEIRPTGRKVVSITKLIEDPKNERKTFRNLDGLVDSIKAHGLIEPITVFELEPDVYQIITGHRRYRASKLAGLKQVEIIIRAKEEATNIRQKSIISNIQREDVNPIELAEGIRLVLDEENDIKTQGDLGKRLGKSKSWISSMLRILSLSEEAKEKVSTSKLSVSYDAIADIARLEDKKLQDELVDNILTGVPVKAIREKIHASKGGKQKKKTANATKPKQAYHTKQKATVIVQSETGSLSKKRVVEALSEALEIAKKAT